MREVNPLHSGGLPRALVVVLPTNQCAAADALGTVRLTMLVLGERRKSGEMSVGIERSIRGDATVRVGPAAEAHTGRTHSLELQCGRFIQRNPEVKRESTERPTRILRFTVRKRSGAKKPIPK